METKHALFLAWNVKPVMQRLVFMKFLRVPMLLWLTADVVP